MTIFFLIFKVAMFCMVKRPIIIKDLCSGLQVEVLEILVFNSVTLQMSGSAPVKNSSDPTVAWLYLLNFIDWA